MLNKDIASAERSVGEAQTLKEDLREGWIPHQIESP